MGDKNEVLEAVLKETVDLALKESVIEIFNCKEGEFAYPWVEKVIVVQTIIISNQPYFYKKAELFPGSAFVIAAGTAVRLINEVNGIKVLQLETAAGAAIRV
ncbi:hypothetical protein ES332_D08G153200v1 [Gossypium tomentosum]|uniref:Uncharacterized protein n=1 Tax=Gossypium tomentosum TaxID=34277 RepID=A0A5D2JX98_GOSTO|nr:hypothetical protein ES332_D08G153200v1 [Gossypium tomentosum]